MIQAPQILLPRPARSYSARFVAPFLFMLVPGTGGAFAPESIMQMERWSFQRAIDVRRSKLASTATARTTALRVMQIRDSFGLNMSELAGLLEVSRPTAYAWLNGQVPQPEAVTRILRLSAAADFFSELPAKSAQQLVRQPVLNGQSLLAALKTDVDATTTLSQIAQIVREREGRPILARTSGRTVRPIRAGEDFSTPATYERD